ncbi:hypothetical protein B7P34_05055 [Streptosporangium nondiastaticum]|uniref:Uncharacterized protein n=1 Tax=Streptosporangium nondiastaticum TaxID=35764 RepID=A0A9X7JUC0_9ACTN|nr:hypothetical protein [Streptosporangium nondiastaticum]PSJ29878.1 hypothetical protein B7P34_05055 [Streptosporangium nondiastaticum]
MSNQPHHTYDPQDPYDSYDAYDARTQRYDAQSYGQQDGAYGSYDQQQHAQHQHQQHAQHQQQHQPQQQAQQPQAPSQGHGSYGDSYGAYDAYAQQHQPQHQQPQPQQYQWPTNGGQGFSAHDEPVTQTWQTPTWDTGTWQQPPVPQAEDRSHGTSWSAGSPLPEERPAASDVVPRAAAAVVPAPVHEPAPLAEPGNGDGDGRGGGSERPMTAAEKAKAEGRAQILSPGLKPALVTAALAALLALTAPLGQFALAVPLVLLQAVTAAGWFRLNGMWPARQGIALAFLGGVAADIGMLATDRSQAPTVVIGTLGVWILLVIVLQLRSHASPDERLYGLTAAAASSALAVLAAGHLAASSDAVVVGASAVAVTALARALPLPSLAAPVVALLAAAGSGLATAGLTDLGTSAALLGLAAGACALIGLRVASYDYPSRFVHMTAGVALPLAAAAPAVYVLGRVLG